MAPALLGDAIGLAGRLQASASAAAAGRAQLAEIVDLLPQLAADGWQGRAEVCVCMRECVRKCMLLAVRHVLGLSAAVGRRQRSWYTDQTAQVPMSPGAY